MQWLADSNRQASELRCLRSSSRAQKIFISLAIPGETRFVLQVRFGRMPGGNNRMDGSKRQIVLCCFGQRQSNKRGLT